MTPWNCIECGSVNLNSSDHVCSDTTSEVQAEVIVDEDYSI